MMNLETMDIASRTITSYLINSQLISGHVAGDTRYLDILTQIDTLEGL